jgi:hypothetical protein
VKWIIGKGVPVLNDRHKVSSLMGIRRDITNEVKQQVKLESTLKEKETPRKEIHYCVKNNM